MLKELFGYLTKKLELLLKNKKTKCPNCEKIVWFMKQGEYCSLQCEKEDLFYLKTLLEFVKTTEKTITTKH